MWPTSQTLASVHRSSLYDPSWGWLCIGVSLAFVHRTDAKTVLFFSFLFLLFFPLLMYLISGARFNEKAKRTFGCVFPFLKHSFIASCPLELAESGPFRFPSLSSNNRLRLCSKNALRDYMHNDLGVKKILKIHTYQGRECRRLMQKGALYISPGMDCSPQGPG